MKNEKTKKKLTIDEYINIGKGDIFMYAFVTIIVFFISLYIGYKYKFYYVLFITLLPFARGIERIETYYTLKKIKLYLIENDFLDKIGEIDYWNERYYFLTDNYMIIMKNRLIYAFEYSEIKEIFKEDTSRLGDFSKFEEYLHIVTSDNEFRVLIYTTLMVGEDFKDISNYLLKKNPNIKMGEKVKNRKIDMFKVQKR